MWTDWGHYSVIPDTETLSSNTSSCHSVLQLFLLDLRHNLVHGIEDRKNYPVKLDVRLEDTMGYRKNEGKDLVKNQSSRNKIFLGVFCLRKNNLLCMF